MATARLLAFLCCLNLALPPGWCAVAVPAKQATACCRLSHCDPTPPAQERQSQPQCCCEQNLPKPPMPVCVPVDQTTVAALVDVSPLACPSLTTAVVVSSIPINVLNCVWRC